jgi:hypothetical protein
VTITVQTQPAPPVLSTVDTLAYEINKSTDALALNAVGTVALGVSCKPEYDANGLNVVPRDAVKFKTATRPLVVVAKWRVDGMAIRTGQVPRAERRWRRSLLSSVTQPQAVMLAFPAPTACRRSDRSQQIMHA